MAPSNVTQLNQNQITKKIMKKEELVELTDEELLEEAKKTKSNKTLFALLIGFLIGIIIYSVAVNSVGFITLIPLYFIYKMIQMSQKNKDLEALLKERNLK